MRTRRKHTPKTAHRTPALTIMDHMTYEISVNATFSASHQLRLYDGSLEPLHGHNWTVIVAVAATRLDSIGVVMDFHALERRLGKVIDGFHNRHLNDVIPFVKLNPSAENVAQYIADSIELPERVWLQSVEVWETPHNRARVQPGPTPTEVDK